MSRCKSPGCGRRSAPLVAGGAVAVLLSATVPAAMAQTASVMSNNPNVIVDLGVLEALGGGPVTLGVPTGPTGAGPTGVRPTGPAPLQAPAAAPRSRLNPEVLARIQREPVASTPLPAPAPAATPRPAPAAPARPLPAAPTAPAAAAPPPAPAIAAPAPPPPPTAPAVAARVPEPAPAPAQTTAAPRQAAVPPPPVLPDAPVASAPTPAVTREAAAPPPAVPAPPTAASPPAATSSAATPPAATAAPAETPEPATQTASVGDAAETVPGDDGSLVSIGFNEGSAVLPEGARQPLNDLLEAMNADEAVKVQLRAYAAGTAETSSQARRLSLSRALAVRSFLIENGIRTTRMDVRALGNKTGDGPPDRVDVVLVDR